MDECGDVKEESQHVFHAIVYSFYGLSLNVFYVPDTLLATEQPVTQGTPQCSKELSAMGRKSEFNLKQMDAGLAVPSIGLSEVSAAERCGLLCERPDKALNPHVYFIVLPWKLCQDLTCRT